MEYYEKGETSQTSEKNTKYTEILEPYSTRVIQGEAQDRELVKSILPNVTTKYKDRPDTTGGIDLLAQNDKIKISNTLEARLELIAQQLVPQIRTALFGRNVNRRFTD
ncbi:hypothetical protein NQ317_014072 [Molorchus minor]|uniref:Uncharacterized protein n=1 Tax=Molorchus minor TaxID=1323400 RepID=A0ABQ9JG63_9CUCU|nr:hypothetical protein NQ317_014072 [Molorchus minor]